MKKSRGKKEKKINKPHMVSYGSFVLPPVIPGPEVEDLCHKIDNFYNRYSPKNRKQKASDLIKGAFFAIRSECRTNPDWMSQAANSIRDVLYPFWSKESKNNILKLFKKYAADKTDKNNINDVDFIDTFNDLDTIYGKVSDITHHGIRPQCFPDEKSFCEFSDKDFESLIEDFAVVLGKALGLQQIYTHRIIDAVVAGNKRGLEIISDLNLILNINPDSREYFFAKADEKWLDWLWRNNFLDAIKEKGKDENQFSYTLPELQYLASVSEKNPKGVVDIIFKISISEKNFNPEVLNRFIWICGSLPAEQLARVVSKIRDEKWAQLMGKFTHYDFEYGKMLKALHDAKDWKTFLILAEVVLAIRSKNEMTEEEKKYGSDNSFYFPDLSQIKVFEYLVNVDDENLEKALALISDTMKKIILEGKTKDKGSVFEMTDKLGFYDVDFFTLELGDSRHLSYRDDVKNLAATMKKFLIRMIENKPEDTKKIYEKYIKSIPLNQSMWRFRLFAMAGIRPESFKDELKNAFFRFFEESEEYYELISKAEYDQALKKGFSVLSNDDKRRYVKKVIDFFGKKREKKEEFWYKSKGRELLSCIFPELSEKEKASAEKILGEKIVEEFEPKPSIGSGMSGFIVSKAPITIEDLQKKTVPEIVEMLSKEWTPENLRKLDSEKDFMRPLNAEGMGNLLKQDIEQRFELYMENAELFFNRESLDEHYTYSFLQGVYDVMRQDKYKTKPDCNKLLTLIENIIESGKKEKFSGEKRERARFDSWVANWRSVHYAMADMMKVFLEENKNAASIDFPKYRKRLLSIIKYLLSYPDPDIESNAKDYGNDPFSVAINSVRGRAFESLVLFVYRDGDSFKKEDEIKIFKEVEEIYEEVLGKENTYAVMFLFGHYLPSLYYRDKKWIKGLIPKIFPSDDKKFDLYLSAWEGYVSANIYGDMFSDSNFKKLYERAIKINPDDYTKRKYFRELDEGLATHFALAYVHFPDFKIGSDLFNLFWKTKNAKWHEEFVSFVGRHAISRDNAAGFILENKIDVEKIKSLWDWVLNNVKDENVFSGFGFWVDKEQDVFKDSKWLAEHIKKTLAKSKGGINWDYGLIKSLPILAEQAPEETYEILKIYLLDQYENKPEFRNSVYIDDFLAAFNVLYKNGDGDIKSKIHNLISELILKGSSRFWKLKEVIENKN